MMIGDGNYCLSVNRAECITLGAGAVTAMTDTGTVIRSVLRSLGITPFEYQLRSFDAILEGANVIITAPTGWGKTEASIVPVIAEIRVKRSEPIAALYITPLRALINDITARIRRLGRTHGIKVARKHGDVTQAERRRRLKERPHILVTTPESLESDIDLSPGMRDMLGNVRWVIVDEVHEILATKRGAHLAVLLERLRRLAGDYQLIMLSATVSDPIGVLNAFSGSSRRRLVHVGSKELKSIRVEVIPPTSDISKAIKEITRNHRKLLIFIDSRRLAERLHSDLEKMGLSDFAVHHSSVSRSVRESVEKMLKEGNLRAVIATKTLELGIDVGDVDAVINVGPPPSVTALLQRIGRSGHRSGGVGIGYIIPRNNYEYLLSLASVSAVMKGLLEKRIPVICFGDVVARAIAGMLLERSPRGEDEVLAIVTRSLPCSTERVRSIVEVLEESGMVRRHNGALRLTNKFYRIWSQQGPGRDFRRFFSLMPSLDDRIIVMFKGKEIGFLDYAYVVKYLRPGDRVRLAGKNWDIVGIDLRLGQLEVVPSAGGGEPPEWHGSPVTVSELITKELFRIINECVNGSCLNKFIENIASWFRRYPGRAPYPGELFLERYGDTLILYGPYSQREFELLSLLVHFLLHTKRGRIREVTVRSSALGVAIEGGGDLIKELYGSGYSEDLVKGALSMSPEYIMLEREVLPSFGIVKNDVVHAEILRQLRMLYRAESKGNLVKEFMNAEVTLRSVSGAGISPIAKEVLRSPRTRPWYKGVYRLLADSVSGYAFTVEELAVLTGLDESYVERRLKGMRKFSGRYRVVEFYDISTGERRWALAKDLRVLARGEFRECFEPPSKSSVYQVMIYYERGEQPSSFLLSAESVERGILNSLVADTDNVYKLTVKGGCGSVTYYHVPPELLDLTILNAMAYLQVVKGCG